MLKVRIRGLEKAISELEKTDIEAKKKELVERLAILGAHTASVLFSEAFYDSIDNTSAVDVEVVEQGEGKYAIVASGEEVCFIEFGAGVYYNGEEPYPLPRPSGIAGIGEYGKGFGKRDGWVYLNEQGERTFTRGTPAAMPMYHATNEIKDSIAEIAREVFRK